MFRPLRLFLIGLMRRWQRAAVAACAAAWAWPAHAHGSVRGLGPLLGGALHPLLEPAQWVALLALALYIGQRGLPAARPAPLGFVAALGAGLVAAGLRGGVPLDPALLGLAGLLGVAVLCDSALPRMLGAIAAAGVGAGVGLGSDPEAASGTARVLMLLGSGAGATVLMFCIVGIVHEARRPWQRIGMRVVGSWITASATLVMALSMSSALRRGAPPVHAVGVAASDPVRTSRAVDLPTLR